MSDSTSSNRPRRPARPSGAAGIACLGLACFSLAGAAEPPALPAAGEEFREPAAPSDMAVAALQPGREEAEAQDAPASTAEPARSEGNETTEPAAVPVPDADLGLLHGGASVVTNNQTITGTSSHNVLNGDYTAGAVTISDQALSSFEGLANIAINTGAQVTIQSAMSVTVNVGD